MKETSIRKTFAALGCFIILAITLSACSESKQPSMPIEASSESIKSSASADATESIASADPVDAVETTTIPETQTTGTPMIKLTTTLGTIAIELDFENAPNSAANFQQYCEEGFYEGTIFHRVINGFMVQGGGMNEDMSQKETRSPIENEADNGLQNVKGSLAMARTGDPHSATAQFFINVADNDFLNHTGKNPQGWGYAVFGKVVEGMDVVDTMKAVKTGTHGGHQDVPVEAIVIEKCEITED